MNQAIIENTQIAPLVFLVVFFVLSCFGIIASILLLMRLHEMKKEEKRLIDEGKRLLGENLYMRDLTDHEIEM